jgi:hypothetical protein
MNDKKNVIEVEIESLNLETLDVEELEHRLEMAVIGPPVTQSCTTNQGGCYING